MQTVLRVQSYFAGSIELELNDLAAELREDFDRLRNEEAVLDSQSSSDLSSWSDDEEDSLNTVDADKENRADEPDPLIVLGNPSSLLLGAHSIHYNHISDLMLAKQAEYKADLSCT